MYSSSRLTILLYKYTYKTPSLSLFHFSVKDEEEDRTYLLCRVIISEPNIAGMMRMGYVRRERGAEMPYGNEDVQTDGQCRDKYCVE